MEDAAPLDCKRPKAGGTTHAQPAATNSPRSRVEGLVQQKANGVHNGAAQGVGLAAKVRLQQADLSGHQPAGRQAGRRAGMRAVSGSRARLRCGCVERRRAGVPRAAVPLQAPFASQTARSQTARPPLLDPPPTHTTTHHHTPHTHPCICSAISLTNAATLRTPAFSPEAFCWRSYSAGSTAAISPSTAAACARTGRAGEGGTGSRGGRVSEGSVSR